MKRKLLLKSFLSPGDIVMLTAAVRDLHGQYPGRFVTDVRTSCPELWENNPHLTPLDEHDPKVEVLECHYPLINRCNQAPYHCLHGFIEYLNDCLELGIRPSLFKGDIHLSAQEKAWFSQVHEMTGEDTPFWIVATGGKFDITVKWWDVARYQEVVDHFRGKIQFVQVGEEGHYHPPLEGVIDLRGQTDLRQLVRLMYHAQGVVCPVTCLMHLAAAIETKRGMPPHRPCVVIAGGREPPHWEAYPHHQFIHTVGILPCCQRGGCWRSRTKPLGDGDVRDRSRDLCLDVVDELPRCMDMITAAEVIRRIQLYFAGGALQHLSPRQARRARRTVASENPAPTPRTPITVYNARAAVDRFVERMQPYPGAFHGRGIVICAGGIRFFTNAWVCVHLLRRLGCRLPIEFWHLGERELDQTMRALVKPLGVRCIDALGVRRKEPARILRGWELKPYAILHSRFKEVLLLDADNAPVVNPEFLFATPQFRDTGAIFWPDRTRWDRSRPIWSICGVPYRDEPEFETGQIVVNKQRCWAPLQLTMWFNEHSDFFYRYVHGDKDTFRLAFRKLNQSWSMPRQTVQVLRHTFCQHDFTGRRIFQHRNQDKWNLFLHNEATPGFRHEAACRRFVRQLRRQWDGRMSLYRAERGASPRPGRLSVPPVIKACMISCPQRAHLRRQTLRSLAASDWGNEPVQVRIDEGLGASPKESQCRNAWRALCDSLATGADYILFLEDDLEFNRFFRHNLRAWRPLRQRTITVASLFNPGIEPAACDVPNHGFVADPYHVRGSLALLLSRDTVHYLVRHWDEEPGGQDVRIARLAGRLKKPLWVHAPSLVQHTGVESTWDTNFYPAVDFAPTWKAGANRP